MCVCVCVMLQLSTFRCCGDVFAVAMVLTNVWRWTKLFQLFFVILSI
jgi:hypothetical protein